MFDSRVKLPHREQAVLIAGDLTPSQSVISMYI